MQSDVTSTIRVSTVAVLVLLIETLLFGTFITSSSHESEAFVANKEIALMTAKGSASSTLPVVVAASPPAHAPPALPPRLQSGMYAGETLADGALFDMLVDHKMDMQAVFVSQDGKDGSFPLSYASSIRDQGKTMVLFWEQSGTTLDQIIDGSSDAYIKQFAATAKAYGGPVLLSPFHEMNGYWTPWSGVAPGNSPQKLILAWRHVRDLFQGVSNVRFVFTVNSDSVPDTAANSIASYYPGDAYVDDVAVDGFNFGSPWYSFDSILRAPLTQLATYKKPIYILSMASAQGPEKAAWITDAFTVQLPKYPGVVGWVWFNQNKEQNWLVSSDPASLAAFKAVVR